MVEQSKNQGQRLKPEHSLPQWALLFNENQQLLIQQLPVYPTAKGVSNPAARYATEARVK